MFTSCKKIAALFSAAAITFAGCSAAAADIPAPAQIDSLSPETVSQLNEAGVKLYNSMQMDGNTFISPVSIYLAYAMLYNGALEESAKEMQDNLFTFNADLAKQNGINQKLVELIRRDSEDVTLNAANSIWISQTIAEQVRDDYMTYNREYLGAKADILDFSDTSGADVINQWVKENTNGMIEKMVDTLSPDHMLFLLNALYLDAKWKTPFDASLTQDADFLAPSGKTTVKMMALRDRLDYYEDDTLQAVRLPYADEETSMLIVLPKDDITAIQPFNNVASLLDKLKEQDVWLTMPKVDLQYSDDGKLQSALIQNGVSSIFDPGKSNLNGIADVKDNPLYVGETRHKTALKIDEEGTQAAAATSIGIMRMSMIDYTDFIRMDVNKPFYCAILDDTTGLMLFCGSIQSPGV